MTRSIAYLHLCHGLYIIIMTYDKFDWFAELYKIIEISKKELNYPECVNIDNV